MESYLSKRALELTQHYETLLELHTKLMAIVDSHGHLDVDPDVQNAQASAPKVTPAVPIAEGWEAVVYLPEEDPQSELIDPVMVHLRPSVAEGGDDMTLPYLFEDAGVWIAVGEDKAINDETLEPLTDEEIEGLYHDAANVIEPYLIGLAGDSEL